MRMKVFESQIPCGSPFINTYKYYVDTLAALRLTDLESKLLQIQQDRYAQFVARATGVQSLASLMTENNPAYRRSALDLAGLVTVKDLADLNSGTYFDQNLYVGFLQLVSGINEVAVEIAKLP